MQDLKLRLIETAVRPLDEDAEMKLAASHLLEELVKPDPECAVDVLKRWEAVDAKPDQRRWQLTLWASLLVIAGLVMLRDYQEIGRYVAWREWIGGNMTSASWPEPAADFIQSLTHQQRLLLGGDPELPRKEALVHLAPENPAYFAEYAVEYATEFKSLPPDFLETARRLDPENAWFTWFAASVEVKGALENKSLKQKQPDGSTRDIDTWKVLDPARVDRASALIVEARSQAKFENYANEMLLKRQALFPIRTLIDRMDGVGQIANASHVSNIKLMDAAFLQIARSWLAAEAGDVVGFQNASQDGERFLRNLADSDAGTMLNGVIEIGYLASISKAFAEGAEKLGLKSEASRWKAFGVASAARRTAARSNVFLVDGKVTDPQLVGGMLFRNFFEVGPRTVEHPPALTDADLKPGRMLDHEILSRLCGYLTWVAMGFSLLAVVGYRFRVAQLVRRLAWRMEQLLVWRDWVWVFGAGIVLPLTYVMAVNRLTPLGGRQFGMIGNAMLLPAGHFLGLVMLWLVGPLQIGRWRMAKRAACLGFPRTSWLGWLVTAAAVAFVPLIGWAGITRSFAPFWKEWMETLNIDLPSQSTIDGPWRWWLAIGVLAVPVLWLGFSLCGALLSSTHRLVHHATTARILGKTIPAAMLLISLATIAFKKSEISWLQRDHMLTWDSGKPGWMAYEADIARQLKKEMRELLGSGH